MLLRFERLKESDVYYKRTTADGQRAFIYHFSEDGTTLQLLFRYEKYIPAEELSSNLTAAGFPVPDLTGCSSVRDYRLFQKTMYGKEFPLDYAVSYTFDSADAAVAFLDGFIPVIQDENGFDITNPQSIDISKPRAYCKESGENLLVFAFDYPEGSEIVNLEFRIMENIPEEEEG